MVKQRPQSRPADPGRASLWQAPDSGPNGTAYVAVRKRSGPTGIPVLPTRSRGKDTASYLRAHAHEAACGNPQHVVRCEATDREIERLRAALNPRPGVRVGRLPNGYRKVCQRKRPACTVLGCGSIDRLRKPPKPMPTVYPKPWADRPVGGVALQRLMSADGRAEAIKAARAEIAVCRQAIREIRRVMGRAEAEGNLSAIGPLTRDLRTWQAKQRVAAARIKAREAELTEAEAARAEGEAQAARNRLTLAEERLEEASAEAAQRAELAEAARAELERIRGRKGPAAPLRPFALAELSRVDTLEASGVITPEEARAERSAILRIFGSARPGKAAHASPEAERKQAEARERRNARERARRAERKRIEAERLQAVGFNQE